MVENIAKEILPRTKNKYIPSCLAKLYNTVLLDPREDLGIGFHR